MSNVEREFGSAVGGVDRLTSRAAGPAEPPGQLPGRDLDSADLQRTAHVVPPRICAPGLCAPDRERLTARGRSKRLTVEPGAAAVRRIYEFTSPDPVNRANRVSRGSKFSVPRLGSGQLSVDLKLGCTLELVGQCDEFRRRQV